MAEEIERRRRIVGELEREKGLSQDEVRKSQESAKEAVQEQLLSAVSYVKTISMEESERYECDFLFSSQVIHSNFALSSSNKRHRRIAEEKKIDLQEYLRSQVALLEEVIEEERERERRIDEGINAELIGKNVPPLL